jgi:hypothetical protein
MKEPSYWFAEERSADFKEVDPGLLQYGGGGLGSGRLAMKNYIGTDWEQQFVY